MTRPAPSCFTQDNTRADGFSGHEIYAQMTGGPGTGTAQVAANTATALERTYASVESRLKRVGETLGESWSGASADAAQAAANPINQAMIQMQDALRQADHSLSNQVYQFNLNKGQLKNMPASKPETGFWDDATPWDTDTEDKVNSYNSEESHNRKIYSEFQSASNTNRGDLPKEFPGVTADNLSVEVVNTGGNNGEDKTTNTSSSSTNRQSTTGFPQTTGSPQGPGGTWTPPGSITGDRTDTSWVSGGDDRPGGSNLNRPGDLGNVKPPVGSVIDRPLTTGIPPIGVPGGPGLGGGGGGRGPGGGGAGGGKFGGGGGGGAGGKFGGGGLGGTGTGGSGTAAGQQAGSKAGVFGAMGDHGPNAGARGGAAGAAGRGGAAGMGGMGGQGQKGQGEDDLEHKSADYLITEENTNEIIGDMPMVAPPTIGG